MTAEVLAFIREQELLKTGDTVVCAVSGGADSTALLFILEELQAELGFSLRAAHYNHMLRGVDADADEAFVSELCKRKGIPLIVGRGNVAAEAKLRKTGIEETARDMRYAFLEETIPSDMLIATAHNADDNAETVLMHLLRGAGSPGLSGIAPKRGRIIRPLLPLTHEDACAYLRAKGATWCEDATNRDNDCLRNRLRHFVMPAFAAENPRFSQTVLQSSFLLREENRYMDQLSRELLKQADGLFGLRCAVLKAAPAAIRRRSLISASGSSDFHHIMRLEQALLREENGTIELSGSCRAVFSSGWLTFSPEMPVFERAELSPECGPFELASGDYRIRFVLARMSDHVEKNSVYLALPDTDTVITARSRESGDVLNLPGGKKTIKKAMIDKKIPVYVRDFLPIICYNNKPVAVPLIGADKNLRPRPGDPALLISFEKSEP